MLSIAHFFGLLACYKFYGGIRDNDPALRGLFLFQPACEDAVLQGSHIESRFYNLRLIHSEDSDSKLALLP